MSHNTKILIIVLILIIFIVLRIEKVSNSNTPSIPPTTTVATTTSATTTDPLSDLIRVTFPKSGSEITSPVSVEGLARGYWFFEANAGVKILDADKKVVSVSYVMAKGEWMTEDFVPFKGTIVYPDALKGTSGYVEFSNDNPSGLPENQKTFLVPVLFK